jgi:hypothetical protein
VLIREGEWNDTSEGFAQFLCVCEGCFDQVRARNEFAR